MVALDAFGKSQYAILALSKNHVTLMAPVKRFTHAALRVDGHPFVETLTWGNGAIMPDRFTSTLIAQMLSGKEITPRFVESGSGKAIERSLPLDGFPKAYTSYEEEQRRLVATHGG